MASERRAFGLSVVIPVYNEPAAHLQATLTALAIAATRAEIAPHVVIVDDGSSVAVADGIDTGAYAPLQLRILRQENGGRLRARMAGLAQVSTPWVLLLDARITVSPGSLAFVRRSTQRDEQRVVFNGDVSIVVDGKPFGRFWRAVTSVAWHGYFANPRELSFGVEDFDHYPKGTGMLLTRTDLLRDAIDAFESVLDDERLVSDDTAVIRGLAERRIWLSPEFGCSYEPRTTAKGFFKQVFYRGTTFYDGFARPGTRFTTLLQVFPAVSIVGVAALVLRPKLLRLAVLLPAALTTLALRRRVSPADAAVLGGLSLPFAAVYSAGIWRGVLMARVARKRKEIAS